AARALAEAAASRRQPDAQVARGRVRRDGRTRPGVAHATRFGAEPLRHDDRHQRLQPADPDRRSSCDQHGGEQACLRVSRPGPGGAPAGAVRGFRGTVWAGLSKLPRRQPIGDALDELMTYNLRVRRVKQMIGAVEDDVLAAVEPLLPLGYSAANEAANAGAI